MPLGDFVPLCEKFFEKQAEKPKMAGFGPKIWILGPETARKRRFQAVLTIFHLRGPLRLVSVDDFLPEAYSRAGKRELYARREDD